MRMVRRSLWVSVVVAVVAVLSGCASDESAPQVAADLPSVELTEVASGSAVALDSLIPSTTPVLAWFWAPH